MDVAPPITECWLAAEALEWLEQDTPSVAILDCALKDGACAEDRGRPTDDNPNGFTELTVDEWVQMVEDLITVSPVCRVVAPLVAASTPQQSPVEGLR